VDAEKLLDAVMEQTYVLQDIRDNKSVQRKRAAPSNSESKRESATPKHPSSHRSEVNKKRRIALRTILPDVTVPFPGPDARRPSAKASFKGFFKRRVATSLLL
jgi:hypothetical protein